jgi:Fur family ferric uptake transcriptional regulator
MSQPVPEPLPQDDLEKAREIFQQYLATRGLRITNQRLAIFDAAYRHSEHFTAEELLEQAREIDRSVSRATVYRTLPILTESSLVKEIDVGRDYKFYIANRGTRTKQSQVVCLDCDKIFDIDAPFLEWYANSVAQKVGLEPESARLQVHARCPKAKTEGGCENARPA